MKNMITDFWYALTSPEKYRDFMNYKNRKLFLYVFLLVCMSGFFSLVIPSVDFFSTGGIRTVLDESIPAFTASNTDGFWIEEPLLIDEYNFLIKADSSIVNEDITDLNGQFGSYDSVIVVDKEQIYVKTAGAQEVLARFDEMADFSFSKEDILAFVPVMYVAALWVIVFLLLFDYGYYFLTAFVISWIAKMIASFMDVRIKKSSLFKMSVYAYTFAYLLATIQGIIGKSIPNFALFSLIISSGYMFFAIKDYKDSGIEELPPEQFRNREE